MKNIIQVFSSLVFLLLVTQTVVAADLPVVNDDAPMRGMIETTNAIESSSLRISLGADLKGFIEGKVCDFCETMKVNITPQTKAFENDVEVPLERAKSRLGRYATVIYELETKNVSAIRW